MLGFVWTRDKATKQSYAERGDTGSTNLQGLGCGSDMINIVLTESEANKEQLVTRKRAGSRQRPTDLVVAKVLGLGSLAVVPPFQS